VETLSDRLKRLRQLQGKTPPIASFDPDDELRQQSIRQALQRRIGSPSKAPLIGHQVAPGLLETVQNFDPDQRHQSAPSQSSTGARMQALRQLIAAGTRPTKDALQSALRSADAPSPLNAKSFQASWRRSQSGGNTSDNTPIEATRIVAFDTETSSLFNAAGTMIFMLGAAIYRDQRWQTLQWTLLEPGAYRQMMERFVSLLTTDSVLVSYNGKRFDVPLLQSAFSRCQLDYNLQQHEHWDLMYPVRKRYRGEWPNCKLQTAEQKLLHFFRTDDMPGSAAPAAWRAFLQSGATKALLGITEHHRHDLISLVELIDKIEVGSGDARSGSGE
jgi:uncharacterized protein